MDAWGGCRWKKDRHDHTYRVAAHALGHLGVSMPARHVAALVHDNVHIVGGAGKEVVGGAQPRHATPHDGHLAFAAPLRPLGHPGRNLTPSFLVLFRVLPGLLSHGRGPKVH